ncbi:LOW QUALITY PROTEIN: collagen alpha-1(II) chain, partial [Streptomyces sp. e14]
WEWGRGPRRPAKLSQGLWDLCPANPRPQEQVGLAYAGWDRLLTRVALPAWRMGRWPSRLDAGVVAALTELSRRDRLAEGFASRLGERPACDLLEEPGAVDEATSLLAARLFHGGPAEQGPDWAPVDWQAYPEEVVDRKWRTDAARLHRVLDALGVPHCPTPSAIDPHGPTLARVLDHLSVPPRPAAAPPPPTRPPTAADGTSAIPPHPIRTAPPTAIPGSPATSADPAHPARPARPARPADPADPEAVSAGADAGDDAMTEDLEQALRRGLEEGLMDADATHDTDDTPRTAPLDQPDRLDQPAPSDQRDPRHQPAPRHQPDALDPWDRTDQTDWTDQADWTDQFAQSDRADQSNWTDQIAQTDRPDRPDRPDQIGPTDHIVPTDPTDPTHAPDDEEEADLAGGLANERSAALAAGLTAELAREEAAAPAARTAAQGAGGQGAGAPPWDQDSLPLFPLQPPRTGRELLADHVTAMVCCAAMDTAGAVPGLDWLDGPTLLVDGVRATDLGARVLALVEDGDPVPLRTWLIDSGIRPEKPVRLG